MTALAVRDMEEAAWTLEGIIHSTALQSSRTVTAMTGAEVWLKPECLQKAGSWKVRGAYVALSRLSAADRARGIVTFSAGNWGQGVAYAASLLGVRSTIVLPDDANARKRDAIVGYGAHVVAGGGDSERMYACARALADAHGMLLLNPLDNRDMMIGAASIGLEIMDERPGIESIVVPVGGGALIAGVASGARYRKPGVRVYGVQAEGACAVYDSLLRGEIVELAAPDTIADGLRVKRPSAATVALVGHLVDEIVLVSDDEIRDAMYVLLERGKLLVEPAGAAGLAALLCGRLPSVAGSETAVVLSGGNADLHLLSDIIVTRASAPHAHSS